MEDLTERIERPALGAQGDPCPQCGTALARDQRYCLVCGARRAGLSPVLSEAPGSRRSRVDAAAPGATVPVVPAVPPDGPWRLDAGLLAGVGCLLLALLVGVLIGHSGNSSAPQQASAPQVVQLGATPTPSASGGKSATASFSSDWPEGKRGFTVQLRVLPKAGTDAAAVAAAKQAAAAKGAPDVGALDSDGYGTLPGGHYVVYSGQYADRRAATAALKKLHGDFPGAKVVEVASKSGGATKTSAARSAGGANPAGSKAEKAAIGATKAPSAAQQAAGAKAIQDIQSSSGSDYSKKSAKLPKTLVTPGTPPPVDNKPAGGGSGTETFK